MNAQPSFAPAPHLRGKEGLFPNSAPHREAMWNRGFDILREGRRALRWCRVEPPPVLSTRAGVHSPRAASPETPRAAGRDRRRNADGNGLFSARFFRGPVTAEDCDSARKGGCRVSQTRLITESFPREHLLPSGAVLRKTLVCSGVCWTLICMCMRVFMGVHVHTSVCLHVHTCVCVLFFLLSSTLLLRTSCRCQNT